MTWERGAEQEEKRGYGGSGSAPPLQTPLPPHLLDLRLLRHELGLRLGELALQDLVARLGARLRGHDELLEAAVQRVALGLRLGVLGLQLRVRALHVVRL